MAKSHIFFKNLIIQNTNLKLLFKFIECFREIWNAIELANFHGKCRSLTGKYLNNLGRMYRTRMTTFMTSEAQKSWNGQTDKVSYRADFNCQYVNTKNRENTKP